MLKCVKQGHCPIGLTHCCDICPVQVECKFTCTDSNCEVRKSREESASCSFSGECDDNPWPLRSK